MRVLEPEGGKSDLADAARDSGGQVDVVECSPALCDILALKGHTIIGTDCLALRDAVYDRVIMNPPFENGQDMQHVRHAFRLLKPGGRLAAVMSAGSFSRSDAATQDFRARFAACDGTCVDNPEGALAGADAFRSTLVRTVRGTIDRPA